MQFWFSDLKIIIWGYVSSSKVNPSGFGRWGCVVTARPCCVWVMHCTCSCFLGGKRAGIKCNWGKLPGLTLSNYHVGIIVMSIISWSVLPRDMQGALDSHCLTIAKLKTSILPPIQATSTVPNKQRRIAFADALDSSPHMSATRTSMHPIRVESCDLSSQDRIPTTQPSYPRADTHWKKSKTWFRSDPSSGSPASKSYTVKGEKFQQLHSNGRW
jgi:hypothetical protein